MADKTTEPTPEPTPTEMNQTQLLASLLGDAIAAGIAKAQPKKISFGQYDPKTVFHPNKATAVKFTRVYYDNGHMISWETCFDKEAALLNRITHSGRYIDRLVEVQVVSEGGDESVHLRYNNRTADQRFTNKGKWRDLTDMLEQIVKAQDEENAEDEMERVTRPAPRARHFGDNKNYREAVAKAAGA